MIKKNHTYYLKFLIDFHTLFLFPEKTARVQFKPVSADLSLASDDTYDFNTDFKWGLLQALKRQLVNLWFFCVEAEGKFIFSSAEGVLTHLQPPL